MRRRYTWQFLPLQCLSLALWAAVFVACGRAPEPEPPALRPAVTVLSPQVPREEELAPGESHRYRLLAAAGEAWKLSVEQLEVDVVVTLENPDGETLLRMDGLIGSAGFEHLEWVTEVAGTYTVGLQAHQQQTLVGRYRVEVRTPHPASAADHRRAEAVALLSRADALRDTVPAEESEGELEQRLDQVMGSLGHALELFEALGENRWRAETLARMGFLREDVREHSAAAYASYRQALEAITGQDDPALESGILYHLGWIADNLSEVFAALQFYERALVLRRNLGNRPALAITLNDLGYLHANLGEWHQALKYYEESLTLWRQVGNRSRLARTLHNRGRCNAHLGRTTAALDDLSAARDLREVESNPFELASTLTSLGFLHLRLDEPEAARQHFERAAALTAHGSDVGTSRWRKETWGVILTGLGATYDTLGHSTPAAAHLHRALATFQEFGDRRHEADVLRRLAVHLLGRGELEPARALLDQGLARAREISDRRQAAAILLELSRLQTRRGEFEDAQRTLEQGIAVVEDLRVAQASFALRTDFFASAQMVYEEYIDLLMTRHQEFPHGDFAAQAFAASEHTRARSLLDTLEANPGRAGCEGAEDLLVHQIHALELTRLRLLVGGDEKQRVEVTKQLNRLLAEVRERGETWNLSCAAGTPPKPLDSDTLRTVLDADSLLLEYKLGERRSFLWVLSREGMHSYELPPRQQVEELARRAWEQLRGSHRRQLRGQVRATLAELSAMILGPAAEELDGQPLLVVAEDALHYIPFAALPLPAGTRRATKVGEPLVSVHKVVQLPSAAALVGLRARNQGRAPAPRTVAVIADPVFDHDDERVTKRPWGTDPRAASVTRGGGQQTLPNAYLRLQNSAQEVAAISNLVPEAERLVAVGFEANRELVLSGRLLDYRVLHFATHGRLDTVSPELSGLMLSRIDANGQPTGDGQLRVQEIFRLHLAADLVALSACETALGREVRGEGLVGLAQGFFHAGASRVLVSLWNIDDQATAHLMVQFYRGYLAQGLGPAAALQRAQNTVRQEPGWSAPYYWAAFVLLGDD